MKNKERLIVTLITLFLFSFTSVGYALYNAKVEVEGNISFGQQGKIAITNVSLTNHNNLQNPVDPEFTDNSINFNLNFKVNSKQDIQNKKYNATYNVTITNGTFYDYAFASSIFTPSVETTNNEDMVVTYSFDGIELNENIPAGTSKTFSITINMYPTSTGNFNVSGEAGVDVDEKDDEGNILASIPKNTTGDLTGDNYTTKVTATVINSHKYGKNFTFSINNNNFSLVDQNGNPIGSYSIEANSEKTYDIYIKRKEGVTFPTETQSMNIYFEPQDDAKTSMGVVVLSVDKDATLTDDIAPQVTDVTATMLEEKGKVKVEFKASDDVGVDYETIEVYKKSGSSYSKIATYKTDADDIQYIVTDLADGTYYFKVYATDTIGNTASSSEISSCSTNAGTCSRSTDLTVKWNFTVTTNLSNARYSGPTSVEYGQSLSGVLSGSGTGYNCPTSITVTMGGTELSAGTDYKYDGNTGELSIQKVTGDIRISGSGRYTCFVEGTKIRLANGKTKNIEDITYLDLLQVYSYDTGTVTQEYPLWIEKKKISNEYTEITFSDNTKINIVGAHSFFNVDINTFVNAQDKDNFHIGSKIGKVNKNGKLVPVKVKNIKQIKKQVNYYFVGSTTYYNVIANDMLTTDGTTMITNLYQFDNNAKWINKKEKILAYEHLKDVLPYYMYKGFRAGEVGILLEKGIISLEEFKYYITTEVVNPKMLQEPITKQGKRYWMVTTDKDNVTKKEEFLKEEGSYYTLPKIKDINGWLCTANNKTYKPGDKIKVVHGLHFKSIY